jgi:hypothetical protein
MACSVGKEEGEHVLRWQGTIHRHLARIGSTRARFVDDYCGWVGGATSAMAFGIGVGVELLLVVFFSMSSGGGGGYNPAAS